MVRKVSKNEYPDALVALECAAKKAQERARRTGTPAYVMENAKIINVGARSQGKRNKRR
jgi:hypothetical protein